MMSQANHICLMIVFSTLFYQLRAQNVSSYSFAATSGTYGALSSGATNVPGHAATDDDYVSTTAITIPFSFRFGNTQYNTLFVSSNGWASFTYSGGSLNGNTSGNASTARPILMPLWDDLQNRVIPRYRVDGTAPNRIFKLEWSQSEWSYLANGDVISFQVWLYEGTNQIDYIYNQGATAVNSGSATIGIYDAASTYLTLNGTGTSPTASSSTFTTSLNAKPANGQIYRFTPPTANYRAYIYNINYGSSTWCSGETRSVSVSVKNTGTSTWTNSGPDINIGAKWNAETDHNVRVDANGLAPGATSTYTLSMTAPGTGTNNLGIDVVNEGNCWFRNNPGTCGAGTATGNANAGTSPSTGGTGVLSSNITIITTPAQPSTITGPTSPCVGSSQTFSVTNVAGVTYNWSLPSGWTGSSTTNSITVTVGSGSGTVSVTPSNSCGNGTARTLSVTPVSVPANNLCANATTMSAGGSTSGSLSCATFESPFTSYNDVWYIFTPACGGSYTATLSGLPDDKDLAMFSACGTTTTSSTSTNGGTTNETITFTATAGTSYWFRVYDFSGTGGSFNFAMSAAPVPAQPSTITGTLDPVPGATQTYSVTNVSGVSYFWAFPSGWTINSGQGTNSVNVTVGTTNGTISVTPSNSCGNGTARTATTTIPNYRAQFVSMSTGSTTWCSGESRNISVTVRNTGLLTWTNSSPDVNIGVKWNTNGVNWNDYYLRTDANNLTAGQQQTYNFTIEAKNATTTAPPFGTNLAAGINNLTFDVVNEGNCWFANNSGACGPGNSVFTSPNQTILSGTLGDNTCNPINIGTISCPGFSYSNTQNNGSFVNDYGQSSGDVFYAFTLTNTQTVNIGHCSSGFDTYLHLLNSSGTSLATNDDDGPLCSGNRASISTSLAAGTYYIVSEGFSSNTGNITTTLTTSGVAVPTPVVSGASSVCVGSSSTYNATVISGATYSWTLPSGWTGSSTSNSITVTAGSSNGTISVTATTSCGTSSAGTFSVLSSPKPTVDAGPDQAYCGRNILSANTNIETVLLQETFETISAGTEITPNSTGSLKIATLSGDENWNGSSNVGTKWFVNNTAGGFSCAINNNSLVMKDVQGSGGVGINCDYFWGVDPPDGSYDEMDQVAFLNTNINASLYSNLKVRFSYYLSGDIASNVVYDYMQLVYSTNGGTTWTPVNAGNSAAATYTDNLGVNQGYSGTGTGSTTISGTDLVSLPSSLNGTANLLIGFRWRNDDNDGYVPGLIIDDVYVSGEPTTISWSGPGIVSGGSTYTPTINTAGTYTLSITSGSGCVASDNVVITTPSLSITSAPSTNPTKCGTRGTLTINGNSSNAAVCDWTSNNFNNATGLTLFGSPTPVVEDGRLILTRAYNSKNGGLVIPNSSNFNAGSFNLEFDLLVASGNSADGFSISYGDFTNPTAGDELGHGNNLIVQFRTYSASDPGIHLIYNGTAVTTRVSGTSWRGNKQHVRLTVNSNNQLTLVVGTTTIFNNVTLPSGYINATKKNWKFALSARTGGLHDEHSIDNLALSAYNQYEYSIDGTTWQDSSNFKPFAGTYTVRLRPRCSTSCETTFGPVVISDPTISNSAFLATSSVNGVNLVETCVDNGWTYYADGADSTKWLFGIFKNGNNFTPTVNIRVKTASPTAYDSETDAANWRAAFTMGRYWNVSSYAGNAMKVRFFYDASDTAALTSAAQAWATANPTSISGYTTKVGPIEWFKTVGINYHPDSMTASGNHNGSSPMAKFTPIYGTQNGVLYMEYDGVTSFSGGTAGVQVFPVPNANPPVSLPVKYLYLKAKPIDNAYIQLDWATALEINNSGFDIERSEDGINFTKIGWVDGNGNRTEPTYYLYNDYDVSTDIVYYYRLKQIDFDLQFEYSNIVQAKLVGEDKFMVSDFIPTEVKGNTKIEIFSSSNRNVEINIFNALGQIIETRKLDLTIGNNIITFEFEHLAAGTYMSAIRSRNDYVNKKFVVIR